jgi:hypothetical protein
MRNHPARLIDCLIVSIALALITACASNPSVDAHRDETADFSAYKTFNFVKEPGTNRAGYSTLITTYFKDAVGRELAGRGYVLADEDPDLLVNFNTNVRYQLDARTVPTTPGYYDYRYGFYSYKYGYNDVVEQYPVGTANVDVVDAKRMQLVWEGIAEGILTDETMRDPRKAIDTAVTEMFKRYPARAGAAASEKGH